MPRLITIGKIKNHALADYANEFQKRIGRFLKFEITELKESQKEKEADLILPFLKGHSGIALTIEGKMLDSLAFSDFLFQKNSSFCFILGGPDGISDRVLERCSSQLSLSKMTFPHDLARIIFLEQVYRACTIFAGHPYHLQH